MSHCISNYQPCTTGGWEWGPQGDGPSVRPRFRCSGKMPAWQGAPADSLEIRVKIDNEKTKKKYVGSIGTRYGILGRYVYGLGVAHTMWVCVGIRTPQLGFFVDRCDAEGGERPCRGGASRSRGGRSNEAPRSSLHDGYARGRTACCL